MALTVMIAELGGELIEGVTGLVKARKKLDALPEPRSYSIGNSFVPGTRVVMADGSTKPIEEVETGDEVLATDPETCEQSARTVLATIIGSGSKNLVQITIDPTTERDAPEGEAVSEGTVQIDTESAGIPGPVAAGDVIIATDEHPFWVPDLKAWVDAIDLAPGMWLQTSAGTWVQVNAIQAWSQTATVHNLTVQGVHTYHVATRTLDVLNHNCGEDPGPGGASSAANGARLHEALRNEAGPVGSIQNVNDVLKNPEVIRGASMNEVKSAMGSNPNWRHEGLGRGRSEGQGWFTVSTFPMGRRRVP
jgi:hypothetical protein